MYYQLLVGQWGVSPKDFWSLTPTELFWFIDAKLEQAKDPNATNWDELYSLLDG
ncbi:MAG: phage tail assembly chaperone [Chloroflexi bacterium]|nr:MAG: phage tail assembly chaperone [Chloroflexota bacterium]